MTNAIVKHEPRAITAEDWHLIKELAPVMWKAGLFGVGSDSQAASIMLKGYELGLGLAASFEFIHVIQGKPTLSPRGALALIVSHPEFDGIDIKDETDANGAAQSCTVTLRRTNGMSYTVSFGQKDAVRAGITSRGTWQKYPANMMRWRAIGYAADVVFPDVIGGLKRADELGAEVSPEGDVIEADYEVSDPEKHVRIVQELPESQAVAQGLQALIQEYGTEAVNGAMPLEFQPTLEWTQRLGRILAQECDCLKYRGDHHNGVLCGEDVCQQCKKGRGVHVKGVLCTESEG